MKVEKRDRWETSHYKLLYVSSTNVGVPCRIEE